MTATINTESPSTTTAFVADELKGWLTDLVGFASTDYTRPMLCAVRLSSGTVQGRPVLIGEATNRFILAESWIEAPPESVPLPAPVLVPVPDVKAVIKLAAAAKRRRHRVALEPGDGTVTFRNWQVPAEEHVCRPLVDGTFPRCGPLWVRKEPSKVEFGLNGGYLGTIAAVAARRGTHMHASTPPASGKDGMFVTVGEGFRALIMPMSSPSSHGYLEPTR